MTTTERLLEKVAEGLHQLQQAQLEKLDKRNADEAPEQCKPGTTTLPSLSAPSGNESAVALQDWLEVIDGPLRDISDSSSWWWDAVKKRACDSCRIWVASGPYERLAHKPPTAEEDLEKRQVFDIECENGRNALAGDGRNGSSRDGGEINHEISSGSTFPPLHDVPTWRRK